MVLLSLMSTVSNIFKKKAEIAKFTALGSKKKEKTLKVSTIVQQRSKGILLYTLPSFTFLIASVSGKYYYIYS